MRNRSHRRHGRKYGLTLVWSNLHGPINLEKRRPCRSKVSNFCSHGAQKIASWHFLRPQSLCFHATGTALRLHRASKAASSSMLEASAMRSRKDSEAPQLRSSCNCVSNHIPLQLTAYSILWCERRKIRRRQAIAEESRVFGFARH